MFCFFFFFSFFLFFFFFALLLFLFPFFLIFFLFFFSSPFFSSLFFFSLLFLFSLSLTLFFYTSQSYLRLLESSKKDHIRLLHENAAAARLPASAAAATPLRTAKASATQGGGGAWAGFSGGAGDQLLRRLRQRSKHGSTDARQWRREPRRTAMEAAHAAATEPRVDGGGRSTRLGGGAARRNGPAGA